ncbi:MAG: hypothetical protein EOP88_21090 [Verrucomicrobiaceae bacterium]|nr:MAG: hypothetical protein EOP88_21090 [Verrucomicrobiaceae bacterium]
MRSPTLIALLTGVIVGIGGTLLVRPASRATDESSTADVRRSATKTPREDSAAQERGRVAKRWMDRIENEGVDEIRGQIPAGEMRGVIEKMMAPMWGNMTGTQAGQLVSVISAWAEKDPEAALAWARGLDLQRQREIALNAVAGVVGKTDPMAGFGIYSEIGEAAYSVNCDAMDEMMREVYKMAVEKGADGLLDIANRTPLNNESAVLVVQVDYPPAFDFARLLDGLAPMGSEYDPGRFLKPIIPTEPLAVWASRDQEAAFGYVASRIEEGGKVYIKGLLDEMGKKSGSLETERWIGGKLAAMPPEKAVAFLSGTGLFSYPADLRKYIAAMPPEAMPELQFELLTASQGARLEILRDLPVEDRLSMIERLRDVKEPGSIRNELRDWKVPQDRIEEIVRTVTSPGK